MAIDFQPRFDGQAFFDYHFGGGTDAGLLFISKSKKMSASRVEMNRSSTFRKYSAQPRTSYSCYGQHELMKLKNSHYERMSCIADHSQNRTRRMSIEVCALYDYRPVLRADGTAVL